MPALVNDAPAAWLSGLAGRTLGNLIARGGSNGRLIILTYHRILAAADPVVAGTMDRDTFELQMSSLRDIFSVLPLTEAAARLADGTLPRRAACVTFDDGYADNVTMALPILRRLRLPATFFIATDFIGGGRMWNDTVIEAVRRAPEGQLDLRAADLGVHEITGNADRRCIIERTLVALKHCPAAERIARATTLAEVVGAELPGDLMMTSEQLCQLGADGMDLGAHTMSHPILACLPQEDAEAEIIGSRRRLEQMTGVRVRSFAYPNGRPVSDYNASHVACVRSAGFEVAVSTVRSSARRGCDPHQLPRISAWDRTSLRFTLRLLSSYLSPPAEVV